MSSQWGLRGWTALFGLVALAQGALGDPDVSGLWWGHGVHPSRGRYATRIAIERTGPRDLRINGILDYDGGGAAAYTGRLTGVGPRWSGSYTSSRDHGRLDAVLEGAGPSGTLYVSWSGDEQGAGWERVSRSSGPTVAPPAEALAADLARAFQLDRLPFAGAPPAATPPARPTPPAPTPPPAPAPPPAATPPARDAPTPAPPRAAPSAAKPAGTPPAEEPAPAEPPPAPADEPELDGRLVTPLALDGPGQVLKITGRGLTDAVVRVEGGRELGGTRHTNSAGTVLLVALEPALPGPRVYSLEIARRDGAGRAVPIGELAVLVIRCEHAHVVLPERWRAASGGPRLTVEPAGALTPERLPWLALVCEPPPASAIQNPPVPFATRARSADDHGPRALAYDAHGDVLVVPLAPALETPGVMDLRVSAAVSAPNDVALDLLQTRPLFDVGSTSIYVLGSPTKRATFAVANDSINYMPRYVNFSNLYSVAVPFVIVNDDINDWLQCDRVTELNTIKSNSVNARLEADRCTLHRDSIAKYRNRGGRYRAFFVGKENYDTKIWEIPTAEEGEISLEIVLSNATCSLTAISTPTPMRSIVNGVQTFGACDIMAFTRFETRANSFDQSKATYGAPPRDSEGLAILRTRIGPNPTLGVFRTALALDHDDFMAGDDAAAPAGTFRVDGSTPPLTCVYDLVYDRDGHEFRTGNDRIDTYAVAGVAYENTAALLSKSTLTYDFDNLTSKFLVAMNRRQNDTQMECWPQAGKDVLFAGIKKLSVRSADDVTAIEEHAHHLAKMFEAGADALLVTGSAGVVVSLFKHHPLLGIVDAVLHFGHIVAHNEAHKLELLKAALEQFTTGLLDTDAASNVRFADVTKLVVKSGVFTGVQLTRKDSHRYPTVSAEQTHEGCFVVGKDTYQPLTCLEPRDHYFTFEMSFAQEYAVRAHIGRQYRAAYAALERSWSVLAGRLEADVERDLAAMRAIEVQIEMTQVVVGMTEPMGRVWLHWAE